MKIIKTIILIIVGIALGAWLFSDTQPREVLKFDNCAEEKNTCLEQNELMGLMASVGMMRFGNFVPDVLMETDKTIVIKHPKPQYPEHFVVIPKKDIKNVGELSEGDEEYLIDSWAVINKFVQDNNIEAYRIITNGPGYQSVTYLHFHIVGRSEFKE